MTHCLADFITSAGGFTLKDKYWQGKIIVCRYHQVDTDLT